MKNECISRNKCIVQRNKYASKGKKQNSAEKLFKEKSANQNKEKEMEGLFLANKTMFVSRTQDHKRSYK